MSGKDSRDEPEDSDAEATRDSEPPERDSAPPARDSEPPEEQDEASGDDDEDAPKAKPVRKLSKKARREEEARLAKKKATTVAVVVGGLALAAGGAAGWFGHIEQAKAHIRAESAPAAAGSAGPCGAWEKKICSSSGDQSAACQQAKGATGLMTPGTCEVALEAVPATLAKVKAERASCDSLSQKLCKDLPPDSQTCTMIKERTPMFPADKCKEMLKNYDQVLAEVRQLEQQPPMGMGMPGQGHGPGDGHGHP